MTTAVLTKSLDEELASLVSGEADECLVCGEPVARDEGFVECSGCGSRLENGRDLQVQLRLQAG
jgi:hypothetical protein